MADPDSVFHHYRKLIALRHEHPVVVDGRFELLLPDHEQLWAFTRTLGDDVLLVLANCSSEPVALDPRCRRWTARRCCSPPTPTATAPDLAAVGVAHPLAVTDSDVPLVRALEPA